MPLSQTQEAVLEDLVTSIPDESTWCMFGSVDSVLRGLEDDPSDVDVLATETCAEEIRATFSEAFVETRTIGASRLDEYRICGEEIEVIYPGRATADQDPLVDLTNVELTRTEDRGVPLLPLPVLLAAYRKIDKHETADRLEEQFPNASD